MALEERINNDIKTAMLAKNAASLRALRAIKAAILLAKISESGALLDESMEMKIVQKLVKQRRDSIEIFQKQNREDLATIEKEEVEVLSQYLPQQMSEGELKVELEKIIKTLNASSPSDTGKVMGAASKAFAGKADNRIVAGMVKELLSG
jgi:uncharacterized protein